jgi:hypothetical protein
MNEEAILNYLKTHPDSKSAEITSALSLKKHQIRYALKVLSKSGKITVDGHTSLARWNLSSGAPVKSKQESEVNAEKKFQCPHCPRAFRNLLNMQEHKERSHPEK